MRGGLNDGAGALGGFLGIGELGGVLHKDAAADEDGFGSELHDERGVGGSGDASGGKVGDGEMPVAGDHLNKFVGSLVLFRFGVEFLVAEHGEDFHLLDDLADVLDGVDDVAGAGLSLGADHGGAFGNAAESFAEIAGSADEGDGEGVLVDVVGLVGGGEDLGFVDVVDAEFLEDLSLGEVADAALGHDRDGDGGHDFANLFGRSHAGDSAFGADLRGDALEGHDGDGAGFFGDGGLVGVGDVHDDAAFEHFREAGLEAERGAKSVIGIAIVLRHSSLLDTGLG